MDVKKGTTTLGMVCKDGVVIAADRRATIGTLIADKRAEKIHQITDNMALTLAGTVSDAQLLVKLIKAELKLKTIRTEREPSVKESANMLGGMIYSNIRKFSTIPGISHFLLAGVDEDGYHLYDLFADGSVTKCIDYVASGSGSITAYGVLEALYKQDVDVKDGVALSLRAINAALQRDCASGNGVDVITITKDGVKRVVEKEIDSTIKL
ncbi:MAG: proteasome subunit beta [bacterium]|nr:proteasome subunit beta [bacterium]